MNQDKRHPVVSHETVSTYSEVNSQEYDDEKNRQFLYGRKTYEFVKQIRFDGTEKFVVDIGCGTGLAFEIIRDEFHKRDMKGLGIEPAGGMLDKAVQKFKGDSHFDWKIGSFEEIPVPDKSVDKIVSTLALHWVKNLETAAAEMERVLKDSGSLDILMIAKDDGHYFKKAIVKAQRNHLSFAQIMKTAGLALRVNPTQLREGFKVFEKNFDIQVEKVSDIVYGSFDDHMKWWKARSTQIIYDVKDKDSFMKDLQEELEKTRTTRGIPFDSNLLFIRAKGRKHP